MPIIAAMISLGIPNFFSASINSGRNLVKKSTPLLILIGETNLDLYCVHEIFFSAGRFMELMIFSFFSAFENMYWRRDSSKPCSLTILVIKDLT